MFLDSLDIAKRTCQIVGCRTIKAVDEDSKQNAEISLAYDKVRRAELRRNIWRFSIRQAVLRAIDENTMQLVPDAYAAATTYMPGAIVADDNGVLWTSNEPDNINNTPGDTDIWDVYFGPLSVSKWDEDLAYSTGELVYVPGVVAGSYTIYESLQTANEDTPGTATAYDATVIYHLNECVTSGGSMWRSLIPVNIGTTPADGPSDYDATSTYSAAQTVTGSDNFIYSSVAGSNIGHDPVTDAGVHWTNTGVANAWARTPTVPTASIKWRVIAGTLKDLQLRYPVGTGPSTQATTRNVFRLPANFLRKAAQDPKAGAFSQLGAPSGRPYDDWDIQGDLLVSFESGPITLRFVGDVQTVTAFDDMFCEGLAYRIALATCEAITQSNTKLASIASQYKLLMGEARIVNAIETGSEEPPMDDWVLCRA